MLCPITGCHRKGVHTTPGGYCGYHRNIERIYGDPQFPTDESRSQLEAKSRGLGRRPTSEIQARNRREYLDPKTTKASQEGGYPDPRYSDDPRDHPDFIPNLSAFGLGKGNRGKRKQRKPPPKIQAKLLAANDHRCVYCGNEFGGWVPRRGEMRPVVLHWDHFLPFTAFGNVKDGYVPSCSDCNHIKGDKIFDSIEDAAEYIRQRRKELGFAA